MQFYNEFIGSEIDCIKNGARSLRTTTTQKLTFDEYKNYNDGINQRYELVAGELIPMGLGTGKHGAIAKFLERMFDDEIEKLKQPWTAQKFVVGILLAFPILQFFYTNNGKV